MPDWNPETYGRFADHRLQPALDLIARIGALPGGEIVDLGCGAGAVAPALAARWPGRALIGVDNSPAMLARAAELYTTTQEADIAAWKPGTPPALIFSNAALQWLGDHATLLPRLAGMLASGGTLAVQMPAQNAAPSHAGWHAALAGLFPGRTPESGPDILTPDAYHELLAPLGQVQLWETTYHQLLPACAEAHPVRRFTESTFARPVLAAVPDAARPSLIAAYEAAMATAYPLRVDGTVLFPFRRLFLTLTTRETAHARAQAH